MQQSSTQQHDQTPIPLDKLLLNAPYDTDEYYGKLDKLRMLFVVYIIPQIY